MRFGRFLDICLYFSLSVFSNSVSSGLVWPTPNPAFQTGKPIEAFIQPTASGKVESGLFGCVRNNGYRFHEGIDLYPIRRNPEGEALDSVYSVLPGRVVYINKIAEYSSYGRYVVVQHDDEELAFHTLYAHLAEISKGIFSGVDVASGTVLGVMGRSANHAIPVSRSHLHFEIGFRLSNNFQDWYDQQKFDTENHHGVWNGMNLISLDPLDFYKVMQSGRAGSLGEYLKMLPVVARIRIHASKIPWFIQDYSAFMTRPYRNKTVKAWDIAFTAHGLPKEWTPRFDNEVIHLPKNSVEILAYDPKYLNQSCNRVFNPGTQYPEVSKETLDTLRKLFGFES